MFRDQGRLTTVNVKENNFVCELNFKFIENAYDYAIFNNYEYKWKVARDNTTLEVLYYIFRFYKRG